MSTGLRKRPGNPGAHRPSASLAGSGRDSWPAERYGEPQRVALLVLGRWGLVPARLPLPWISLSDTMYLLITFRKSTPPQNRQFNIFGVGSEDTRCCIRMGSAIVRVLVAVHVHVVPNVFFYVRRRETFHTARPFEGGNQRSWHCQVNMAHTRKAKPPSEHGTQQTVEARFWPWLRERR